jgi:hypothetical protein
LVGTGYTFFTSGLFWRQLRFGRDWLHIFFRRIVLEAAQIWWKLAPEIFFRQIVLEAAQIWRGLAPHNLPAVCFSGISDLAGSGSTLFSSRLFWRQLRFGGNRLTHYFPANCFGGDSDLAGTGSKLFTGRLFWRQLRFGGNWLHIIYRRIVLLAPHYFLADCFGGSSDLAGTGSTLLLTDCFLGSSDLAGTGSTLFSGRLFLEAAQIWRELAPHYFPVDCF